MKYIFFLFCSFVFLNLQAQERNLIMGLVESKDSLLKNVHIKNVSSGKFSVSDEKGLFHLNMKPGDTLVMSHVGMEDLISFMRPSDLQESPVIFMMSESSQELKEVIVNETSEINAVSLGIIPKKIEKLSLNERRLKQAGDFKPIHLLGILGGSLPLDPILNAINGRTKRLKRNINFEQKERNIAYLEINFTEYMQKRMQLTEHEIRLLINEVIEQDQLSAVIESKNSAQIEFYLEDQWIKLKNDPDFLEEP